MRCAVLCCAVLALTSFSAHAELKVSKVSAYLVSGRSGTLSKDVLAIKDFAFWNTVIGEGDAPEPADDVLVTVNFKLSKPEEKFAPITLSAKAKDGGKVLGIRKDINPAFLDGTEGAASIMLYNVTCQNLDIEVRSGKNVLKTANIPFACGE